MIRTIWLAAFCLAGLGGLCASKVTASIYPTEEAAPEQAQVQMVVSDSIVTDTLTKADTAEVAPEAEATGSLPMESDDVIAEKSPAVRTKHLSVSKAHLKVMLPRKRPKIKTAKNSSQDIAAIDRKDCSRPEGLGSLLKSLAGSPHCG